MQFVNIQLERKGCASQGFAECCGEDRAKQKGRDSDAETQGALEDRSPGVSGGIKKHSNLKAVYQENLRLHFLGLKSATCIHPHFATCLYQ